jgi:hypothetical protein
VCVEEFLDGRVHGTGLSKQRMFREIQERP